MNISENNRSGIEWTSYLAVAYAEGFGEGEGASSSDQLEAWAYLIETGKCWSLQGWFGRAASSMIDDGLISENGVIDWGVYESMCEM
jgi:hypothetical protein